MDCKPLESALGPFQAATERGSVIALGTCDGVHRGHQQLISQVLGTAIANGLTPLLLTFGKSPTQILKPDVPLRYIYDLETRLSLIHGLGVEHVAVLTFDAALRQKSAQAFFTILKHALNLKVFIIGHNTTVGSDRADGKAMHLITRTLDIQLISIPPVRTAAGTIIHASDIRQCLTRGEVEQAAEMLGRRFTLRGKVISGAKYGRQIGFPTANLSIAPHLILPKDGVYVTRTHIDDQQHASTTSIGTRPTVTTNGTRSIETYIIDFDQDIYGRTITVEFVKRIRDELKLDSIDELTEWIGRDISTSREVLGV